MNIFKQLNAVQKGMAEVIVTHHEAKDGELPHLSILVYTRGLDAGILVLSCRIDSAKLLPFDIKSSGCFVGTEIPKPVPYTDDGILTLVQSKIDSVVPAS